MRAVDIIRKKRDRETLSEEEIEFFVKGYVEGTIPDYQAAALLMAIFLNGMTDGEAFVLTRTMMHSGKVFDFSSISASKVDKHSTGGVGDKISLPLAPLVAANGVIVPMISGRALGHTGGTLDKLESIPGYKTDLSPEEFEKALKTVGVAIIGQTEDIVPADRKMYALRDVTATVESIPLISASIMSKKLAEGIDGLVLDVKTGTGAFMRKYEDAKKLAETMVAIGKSFGKKVYALLTDMNQPLGRAIGNANEVRESVDVLLGKGPEDVTNLTIELGAYMLFIGNVAESIEDGKNLIKKAIEDGRGYEKWCEMVRNQGGDPDAILKEDFTKTKYVEEIKAEKGGFLSIIDTFKIGVAASILGAGRAKKEDKIDHKVGLYMHKKHGEKIEEKDVIFEVRGNDSEKMKEAIKWLKESFIIVEAKPEARPLVYEVIS